MTTLRTLYKAITGAFRKAGVALFQEVQGLSLEKVKASLKACVGPEKNIALSKKYTGHGNYEYYAIAYSNGLKLKQVLSFDTVSASAFARPPLAIKLSDNGKAFWVVDYHATFTGGAKKIKNEARAMYNITYTTLHGLDPAAPVIIGGDWNLSATDPTFSTATFAAAEDPDKPCSNPENAAHLIHPNVKTSLNGDDAYTNSYDHFAFDKAAFQKCRVVRYHGNKALPAWREISDHAGIIGTFTLKEAAF